MLLACCLIALAATAWVEAAVPNKTLRVAVSAAETSFDPAFAFDDISSVVVDSIMEAMLDYDYLARPVKLVPRTLEAIPTVEEGGKLYICKVRVGIFFAFDPAFKGKRRELTAADHAYGPETHPRPRHQVTLALGTRRQGRRCGRSARKGSHDRQIRLRCAHSGSRGRRPLHP
jgi:hypothetical protein